MLVDRQIIFKVEVEEEKIYALNVDSLTFILLYQIELDSMEISEILDMLEAIGSVYLPDIGIIKPCMITSVITKSYHTQQE